MRNKKLRKIILFFTVLVEVFSVGFYPALAGIHIPSANQVASDLEKRYNLNLGEMRSAGQEFNAAGTKMSAPEVMIIFDPANPKPGEKITAKATPMYFDNQNERLFFTWYLKHKNKKDNKNWDGDGESGNSDENDWKIEAMRKLAQGNFDPSRFNYSGSFSNDGDGYSAPLGGDDKALMPSHCYLHDFSSGINAELAGGCPDENRHFFADLNDAGANPNTGDDSFNADEERAWGTDPTDPDTADTGNFDEANLTGLGQEEFSWIYQEGDKVGVLVEGTSVVPTKYADSSSMIMWALPKNKCGADSGTVKAAQCPDGYTAACVQTGSTINPAMTTSDVCTDIGEDPTCTCQGLNCAICSNGDPVCVETSWIEDSTNYIKCDNPSLGDCDTDGDGYCTCECMDEPPAPNSSLFDPIECVNTNTNNSIQTGTKSVSIKGYTVTIPTTTIDINDCLEDNLVDPREGGQATKLEVNISSVPDSPVNDPTDDDSGDNVAVQASVSNPEQSTQNYKWTVDISEDGSINPDNWRDITDELIDNDLFTGQIEGSNVSDINIHLNLNSSNLGNNFNSYFSNGIGYLRVTAEVRENFSPGIVRYGKGQTIIKVVNSTKKIEAYNASVNNNGTLRIDNSNIICKENGKQDPICFVTKGQVIGLAVSDSGLKNFNWTLNDKTLACDSSVSSAHCGSAPSNYNFFPVTGNVGDTYVVSVTADDIPSDSLNNNKVDTDGMNINLIRKFQIVEPYLSIETSDSYSVWKRWIGSYKDLDGNEYDDLSSSVFETFPGNDMALEVKFHPTSIETDTAVQWYIDGYLFSDLNNQKQIKVSANKDIGNTYNLEVKGLYSQPTEVRKAIYNIWKISEFSTEEQYLNSGIQVEVVEGEEDLGKIDSANKFFASIVKSVPDNLIFFFRLILTVGVVIFVSGLIFSLNPNRDEIYKTKYY